MTLSHNSSRPTALVTGASRGIGADLARELAKDGCDLILVARTTSPMEALVAESKAYGANVIVVPADLSKSGAADALVHGINQRGMTIDILINNAGLGAIGEFAASDPERISEMLWVNIVTLTELTRLVVPGMVLRRRGKIMFVASVVAFQPGPLMAVYSATKAYVLSLGEALAYELRGTGVTVTTVCPGSTATEFFAVAGAPNAVASRPMMAPQVVARLGYKGLIAGRSVVITGWRNRILAFADKMHNAFR